jgi:hypothetical protein
MACGYGVAVTSLSRIPGTLASFATLLLPVVAVGLRFLDPGWVWLIMLLASPVILGIYVMSVVIVSTGFLKPDAAFLVSRSQWRPVVAAIVGPVGALLGSFFLLDGGDSDPWGSPFTILLGQPQASDSLGGLSSTVSTVSFFVGFGAFVWLFVEWVGARGRLKRRAIPLTVSAPDLAQSV